MAISNLSNQHISASFQYLAQISASGNIYDGLGNQINSITNASTASFVNTLNQTLTLSGSLRVSGSTTLNNILTLTPRTTTPTPSAGMIIVSGSAASEHIYCYLNSTWKQLD